jgi:hypothetical protein
MSVSVDETGRITASPKLSTRASGNSATISALADASDPLPQRDRAILDRGADQEAPNAPSR